MYSWRDGAWVPYPPKALQVLLLEEAHISHAHVGGEKLFHLLRPHYYWSTFRTDCTTFVAHCFECQLSSGRTHGSWMGRLLPLPPGPRVEWSLDLITNLGPPGGPKHHLLAAICCYSKFCLLQPIPDKSSTTVANCLKTTLFSTFGIPTTIRTDNGTEFAGATSQLLSAYKVTHRHTSPYTSHSNGQVERLHRTVETLLRRCLVTLPPSTWRHLIPDIQYAINTTYARSTGCPPYLIMFGTTPPHPGQIPDPTTTTVATYAKALQRQLTTISKATTAAHDAYRRRE